MESDGSAGFFFQFISLLELCVVIARGEPCVVGHHVNENKIGLIGFDLSGDLDRVLLAEFVKLAYQVADDESSFAHGQHFSPFADDLAKFIDILRNVSSSNTHLLFEIKSSNCNNKFI